MTSTIAAAVGDTSPVTVSADAALLLAQQHHQQQNDAASAAGITLDDSYMKDESLSFMKVDDASAATDASAYLKDSTEASVKDEGPSTGLSITDSVSGLMSHLSLDVSAKLCVTAFVDGYTHRTWVCVIVVQVLWMKRGV